MLDKPTPWHHTQPAYLLPPGLLAQQEREKIRDQVARISASEPPLPPRTNEKEREAAFRQRVKYYINLLKADWPVPLTNVDWEVGVINGLAAND